MSRKVIFNLLFLSIIFFSANNAKAQCGGSSILSRWVAPPYTSVDKIMNITTKMSLNELNIQLGILPYNILTMQGDGSLILVYNYRIKDRRVALPNKDSEKEDYKHTQEAQTSGEIWYQNQQQRLYVFLKDNKVATYITDEGLKNAAYVQIKNEELSLMSKKEYQKIKDIDWINAQKPDSIFTPAPKIVQLPKAKKSGCF